MLTKAEIKETARVLLQRNAVITIEWSHTRGDYCVSTNIYGLVEKRYTTREASTDTFDACICDSKSVLLEQMYLVAQGVIEYVK